MAFENHGRARSFRVLLAIVTAVFVIGAASPGYADPGKADPGNADRGSAGSEVAAEKVAPAKVAPAKVAPAKAAPEPKEPPAQAKAAPERKDPPGQAKKQPPPQDLTQPQPPSTADENDGGANAGDCAGEEGHAYCSTRDGSPSLNGNGDGKAKGKPCAGCVGKADNKNPPGQAPDGTDHNAGYECDSNSGVGRSNPAHTGCTTVEEPPGEEPPGECPDDASVSDPVDTATVDDDPCDETEEPPGEEPPGDCPDDASVSDPVDTAAVVDDPCDETEEPPTVCEPTEANDFCGEPEDEVDEDDDEVGGVSGERPRPSVILGTPPAGILPQTGASTFTTVLGLGGAALVLTGAGLILVRRRPELD